MLIIQHFDNKSDLVPITNENKYFQELKKYRKDLFKGDGTLNNKGVINLKFITSSINDDNETIATYQDENNKQWTLTLNERILLEFEMEGFSSPSNFNEYPKVKITIEDIKKSINQNEWIFAKTMPHNPHCYSLRKQWDNSIVKFEDFAQYIRENGEIVKFLNRNYIVSEFEEYKYWTMGSALNITILINRTKIKS
jgi:hypothetical protein